MRRWIKVNLCQLQSGTMLQTLAAFRNAALSLMRFHGWSDIATTSRNYASQPATGAATSWRARTVKSP